MFNPAGQVQFSAAANALVANKSAKQAKPIIRQMFANYTVEITRDGVLIASDVDVLTPLVGSEDNKLTGIATRPVAAAQADVMTGSWQVKVESASDPSVYAVGQLSRIGKDGYIVAETIAPTDTISYEIGLSSIAPVPSNVVVRDIGPSKWGGFYEMSIPYFENGVPGQVAESVPIRFVGSSGRWDNFVFNPSAASTGISISVDGGPSVPLDATNPAIPIVDGATYVFSRIVPQQPWSQPWNIYATGAVATNYPLLRWWIEGVAPPTRAPQTFYVNSSLGQQIDDALWTQLQAGDTVHLDGGATYKGFRVKKSGITFTTKPNDTQRAIISAEAIEANYSYVQEAVGNYDKYLFLIFGDAFVDDITLEFIEIRGSENLPASSKKEDVGVRVLGKNWTIKDCYIKDWNMGVISGDFHTGGLTFERNFVAHCGRLSIFNAHSLYLNTSPLSYPSAINIIQDNVFLDGSAQLIPHRTSSFVARRNWFVSNQDQTDGAEGTGVGIGKGGQAAILGGAPQVEDAIVYADAAYGLQHHSTQMYHNVFVAGRNNTPISFGGDSAGVYDFSNNIFVHNTVLLNPITGPYLPWVRCHHSPHSTFMANNIFCRQGGGDFLNDDWLKETNQEPVAGVRAIYSINNSIPASALLGTTKPAVNEYLTKYNNNPLTSQGGVIDATPVAGNLVINGAIAIADLPATNRMHKDMPAIDLTRKTWAVMPTEAYIAAGGKLIPPAAGAANTNIGAI